MATPQTFESPQARHPSIAPISRVVLRLSSVIRAWRERSRSARELSTLGPRLQRDIGLAR
jgi:uncharacterized protein YjiS (DUF1127 family)